jgi:hypothetical protein
MPARIVRRRAGDPCRGTDNHSMTVAPALDTGLDTYRARYVANLRALYGFDFTLAARVDALPFDDVPALEHTRDGHLTARLPADDGRPVYVHSRYRPIEEAQQLIENQSRQKLRVEQHVTEKSPALPEEDVDPAEISSPCFLVTGLGLGYQLAELEARFLRPLVLVTEPDLAVIKAALCTVDLAGMIGDGRLLFLNVAERGFIHERLYEARTQLLLGLAFINMPHSARCRAAEHTAIIGLIKDFIAYHRVQYITLMRNARLTYQNIGMNLPAYLASPGVEVLAGRGQGYPAILVAAGPSLQRNIDQLGPLRDKAVIIAVQTVFKNLLARGTPPHLVCSLDYHEISAQFYHGVEDFGDTILVAEPKTHGRVVEAYRGRKHLLRATLVDDLLRDLAPEHAKLRDGSTVAHLAFYLAEHLGCNPIILLGQDLSFTEGLWYAPGMPIEKVWEPELGRFCTIETKQWERVVRLRTNLHEVVDINGRKAYSDEQLTTYAEQFQKDFVESQSHIIHACEGGMRLQGTDVMTLREAAAKYCTRTLPDDLFELPANLGDGASPEQVVAELEARLEEVTQVQRIAEQTADILAKLSGLTERPKAFNQLVARVDDLRAQMERQEAAYNLVVLMSQTAVLRRIQADRAIHDEQAETAATARRRVRRDREYVAGLIEGAESLTRLIRETIGRMQGAAL